MTQESVLQRAKQGDAEAIASVINYLLKDKNILAKVINHQNLNLKILLESSQILEQDESISLIYKLIQKLEINKIKSIQIYALKTGCGSVVWEKEICLQASDKTSHKNNKYQKSSKSSENKNKFKLYPVWFPYPISWMRMALLSTIGLPGLPLIMMGVGVIVLSLKTYDKNIQSNMMIILGVAFLFISILVISLFFFIAKLCIKSIFPNYAKKIFKYSHSLWEGFYGTFAIAASSTVMLAMIVDANLSVCQFIYANQTEAWECAGKQTGRIARAIINSIEKQNYFGETWFFRWMVITAYLYQIEYLTKNYLMPKILRKKN
ncbi:hypothetical protein [Calothrix sp. UHCC 0171]|uniref:hypothetical protein n=1 Tax=Calothrix sp. UHCC 0171 TaxID=3110245 RepID=UPI002B20359B|nr:hypothetical protein [Calothrix sp. UHCC 0171]MEA5573737.1 hypothetical protein [Calothrix sp. UHCC 0171]